MTLAAIEAGGTKFVLAAGNEKEGILKKVQIPTSLPEEVFPQIFAFFDAFDIEAMGIGSFGPIDVNPASPHYGYITSTPKPGWQNTDFLSPIKDRYHIPLAWTTDVNASAYGELHFGAGRGVDNCVYLTVGTGIGAGVIIQRSILPAKGHPEASHLFLNRHPSDLDFEGFCPYHGASCAEGLAAGPALEKRWGKKGIELADRPEVWELEAFYLAELIYNVQLSLVTDRFILGGGVMKQRQLFPLIRQQLKEMNRGYFPFPQDDSFIVPPELGDNAAIYGCFQLAKELLKA